MIAAPKPGLSKPELGLASQVNLIILLAANLLNDGISAKHFLNVKNLDCISPVVEMLFHEELL